MLASHVEHPAATASFRIALFLGGYPKPLKHYEKP